MPGLKERHNQQEKNILMALPEASAKRMVLLLFLALQERDTFLPSVPVTFSFSLTTEPGMTGGTMRESSEVELFMGFSEKVVEDSTVCGAGRGGGAHRENAPAEWGYWDSTPTAKISGSMKESSCETNLGHVAFCV